MNTTRWTRVVVQVGSLLAGCGFEENIQHAETLASSDGGTDSAADDEDEFPDRVAAAYCAALFACDPVNTCVERPSPYASEAECLDVERRLLQEAQAAARGNELTYDPECVESIIQDFTELGCDGMTGARLRRTTAFQCMPYYGTIPEHENPCSEVVGSNFGNCGRNLFCDQESLTCDAFSTPECVCEPGFDCVIGSPEPNTCYPIAQIGGACRDVGEAVAACTIDAFCATQFVDDAPIGGTCVPRVELGEPCTNGEECRSFTCWGDVCVPESPLLCVDDYAPRKWR